MDTIQRQFILNEYNSLREEILVHINALHNLPQYALLASAIIWTWLYTNKDKIKLPTNIGLTAPILVILLGFWAYAINLQLGRIGHYILLLESKLKLPLHLGWETYFQNIGWEAKYEVASDILWAAIIITNIIVYIYWRKYNKFR